MKLRKEYEEMMESYDDNDRDNMVLTLLLDIRDQLDLLRMNIRR